jgi:hypothetical protein
VKLPILRIGRLLKLQTGNGRRSGKALSKAFEQTTLAEMFSQKKGKPAPKGW